MLKPTDSTRRDLLRSAVGDGSKNSSLAPRGGLSTRRYFRPPARCPRWLPGRLHPLRRVRRRLSPARHHRRCRPNGGLAAGTPYIDPAVQPVPSAPTMPCAAACPNGRARPAGQRLGGYRSGCWNSIPSAASPFRAPPVGSAPTRARWAESALAMDEAGHPVLALGGCVGCGVCVRDCVTSPSSFDLTYAEG